MQYHRIMNIEDPYFRQMHDLMQKVFPPEEVLEYDLWADPLQDPGIRVFVAVQDGEVVGATEYRYYDELQVAMTDFTIIGKDGLGIGPYLVRQRAEDLQAVVAASGGALLGMFAEIYNPYEAETLSFGGVKAMNPFVRREVLAHLGYRKLDLDYVHPSWHNNGEAVHGLDLCFLPMTEDAPTTLSTALVYRFLEVYYAILAQKPDAWYSMADGLRSRETVNLLPV